MTNTQKRDYTDPGFLLRACVAWLVAAPLLLVILAAVLSHSGCGAEWIGYSSSAISFLSAAAAGAVAARASRAGKLYSALVCSGVLTVLLLTVGYIVSEKGLEPSGILSVVSFTLTGCLFGAVFFAGNGKGTSRHYAKK